MRINKSFIKRSLPLLSIFVLMAIFYLCGFHRHLSFDNLKDKQPLVKDFVSDYHIFSSLIFITTYVLCSALSLVPGELFCLLAGFVFPQPLSTLYSALAGTMGAFLVFLAGRKAFGQNADLPCPLPKKVEKWFKTNSTFCILFLRLAFFFPYLLINLGAAFFKVRPRTFLWTTFAGIIPGVFIFTQAGKGIGKILDTSDEFTMRSIFNTEMIISMICLVVLSLLPFVFKYFKERSAKIEDNEKEWTYPPILNIRFSCLFRHIFVPFLGLLMQVCPAKWHENLTKKPTKIKYL